MNKKEMKYTPKYGVIVLCKDEKEQKTVFDSLKKKGMKLKVVSV